MANASKLEIFNSDSGCFEPTNGFRYLDIIDFLRPNPVELPTDEEVFADLKIYDIGETVINALTNLSSRQPDCYVGLANVLGTLKKAADSSLPIKPVVDVSLPLFDGIPDIREWEQRHVAEALDAGCVGGLVSASNSYLAEFHPTVPFFRVSRAAQ